MSRSTQAMGAEELLAMPEVRIHSAGSIDLHDVVDQF